MNDYRAKFDNTKHFEKAIDVAYDSDKEYIRFLKQQLEVKDKMIEAVEELNKNIHTDLLMLKIALKADNPKHDLHLRIDNILNLVFEFTDKYKEEIK